MNTWPQTLILVSEMGKFMKQGKVVLVLGGRFAGRKAVIVKVWCLFIVNFVLISLSWWTWSFIRKVMLYHLYTIEICNEFRVLDVCCCTVIGFAIYWCKGNQLLGKWTYSDGSFTCLQDSTSFFPVDFRRIIWTSALFCAHKMQGCH